MSARTPIPLESVLVTLPTTVQHALEIINANFLGIVFVVDKNRKLLGALTDGDARRDLLSGAKLTDLITEDTELFNKAPQYLPIGCKISDIWKLFEK